MNVTKKFKKTNKRTKKVKKTNKKSKTLKNGKKLKGGENTINNENYGQILNYLKEFIIASKSKLLGPRDISHYYLSYFDIKIILIYIISNYQVLNVGKTDNVSNRGTIDDVILLLKTLNKNDYLNKRLSERQIKITELQNILVTCGIPNAHNLWINIKIVSKAINDNMLTKNVNNATPNTNKTEYELLDDYIKKNRIKIFNLLYKGKYTTVNEMNNASCDTIRANNKKTSESQICVVLNVFLQEYKKVFNEQGNMINVDETPIPENFIFLPKTINI